MKIFSIDQYPTNFQLDFFICELLGSALVMLFGCLGSYEYVNQSTDATNNLKSAFVTGNLVAATAVAVGYICGAYLNPCVTLCSVLLGHMPINIALIYLVAQFFGYFLGMCLALTVVPQGLIDQRDTDLLCGYCSTSLHQELNLFQGFLLEFIGTIFFILCVCSCSDERNDANKGSNPIKFTLLVTMLYLTLIYWVAPLSGTIVATLFYRYLLQEEGKKILQSKQKGKTSTNKDSNPRDQILQQNQHSQDQNQNLTQNQSLNRNQNQNQDQNQNQNPDENQNMNPSNQNQQFPDQYQNLIYPHERIVRVEGDDGATRLPLDRF